MILEIFINIHKASKQKIKYDHLFDKLEKLSLINDKHEFIGKNKEIEIIYVQPSKKEGDNDIIIDFKYISGWINKNKNDGDFENELCEALRKWETD